MHPRSQEPTLARPNMARLSVLSRLIWPSACLSSTLLVATSPATRANLQRRRNPLNWKLLQSSHLPAMSRSGSFSAARTRSASVTLRRYHPAVPTERYGLHDNPGPESQFRCLRHPPDNAEATDRRKLSTKSDADPVKTAPDSLCFVLLVEFERRELDRKGTLALGGSQPHVDFIEALC